MATWTFVSYFIPNILVGLFIASLYEIDKMLNEKYLSKHASFKEKFWQMIYKL